MPVEKGHMAGCEIFTHPFEVEQLQIKCQLSIRAV